MDSLMYDNYFINIWVTQKCNLHCSYCYENKMNKSSYMSLSLAEEVCNFINKKVCELKISSCVINFHGGEPLLNYEVIYFIVNYLKKDMSTIFSFTLTTNVTIINDSILYFLRDNFTEISVSIDGRQESHDLNRKYKNGKSTYLSVLKNAKEINKNLQTRVRMTVTPNNVLCLAGNICYLLKEGFFRIAPIMDFFDLGWDNDLVSTMSEQFNIASDYIYKNNIINTQVLFVTDKRRYKKLKICDGGKQNINIDVNGDIYPCSYSVGNLGEVIGSVKDVINYDIIEKYHNINISQNPECIGCTLYDACISSRCKFINNRLTGNYLKPCPNICAFEKLRL